MDRVHIPPISTGIAGAGARVEGRSDVGRSREENQDYMGLFQVKRRLLAVVADGMGGHSGGYEASRIAVDAMREVFVGDQDGAPTAVLTEGIESAQAKIRMVCEASPDLAGMGTTLVAVLVEDGKAWVGHVGDSRAYHLRGGRLAHLTLDHSRVNRMVREGLIQPDQVADHPMGHILERTVGAGETVVPEIRPDPVALQAGDRLLLCSDGVWSMLTDEELATNVATSDLALAAESALGLALVRGTDDNSTLLVVELAKGPASAPAVRDARPHDGRRGGAPIRHLWPAIAAAFLAGILAGVVPALLLSGDASDAHSDAGETPAEIDKAVERGQGRASRSGGEGAGDYQLSGRIDILRTRLQAYGGAGSDPAVPRLDEAIESEIDDLLERAIDLLEPPKASIEPAGPATERTDAGAIGADAAGGADGDAAGGTAADAAKIEAAPAGKAKRPGAATARPEADVPEEQAAPAKDQNRPPTAPVDGGADDAGSPTTPRTPR